jgi:DNA-binding response OmpR family regulator
LQQVGYRVIAAANGREALERIRLHRPTFIFVDLVMPVMNGFELIRALKSDRELSTIPVVAMTASGAIDVPGVMLMKKPFRAETAVGLIEMLCPGSARRSRGTSRGERAGRRDGVRSRGATPVPRAGRRRSPRTRRAPPRE